MILAGILLLGYQFYFDPKRFFIKKEHCLPILIIGIMGVYLTNALEFWGLQFTTAGKACFLYSFAPIATALLSYVWLSEKITPKKWLGLIIGILGFIPLLIESSASITKETKPFLFLSLAEAAILAAAITTSIGWLAMRETIKNRGASPVMINGLSMTVGGILSLIHSVISEPWNPTPITDFWPFLRWFLILTIISNLISYNLHAMLLRSFSATYLSFVGLSQTFFAAFLGWFFLEEVFSSYFWLSVVAVILGLYFYYQDELAFKNIPPTVS
jgi:drug/metabolite transporter (DMT)-like permease